MAYLIPRDYQVNIQDANIAQIISNDESIRVRAQLAGEAEAQSYLKQKYYIAREFQDLDAFALSNIYYAFNRFYLYADTYSATLSYNEDDLTNYNGNVYYCLNATTGTFNAGDWVLLGAMYDIYTVKAPYKEFSYSALYNIGDMVFYNNAVYQCRVQTSILDHDTALQYNTIQSLPLNNVAPDDPINGVAYWGEPTPFAVSGIFPDDSDFFTPTDNRDAQMVLYCCDIVLYHLHARIAPRNIPELRVKRYDDAIAWLKMCAEGTITPNLPLIQPRQGNRIRYGGNIKQINSY